MKFSRFWTLTATLLLSSLCLSPLVTADDTEIFYSRASQDADSNPNILFILDTSGSMSNWDDAGSSRMDRMKQAMNSLLDQSSGYNVGIMGFSGTAKGGSIRFPIGDLEADSGEQCPNGVCPSEVIVVRPGSGNDDATQFDETDVVVVNSPSLGIPRDPPTIDTTVSTGTEFSNTAVAVSSVGETDSLLADGSFTYANDELVTRWFFNGSAETDPTRYGYRFENIQIPAGATVTSAKIVFTHTGAANQTGDISAYITAEATPNPDPYHDGVNAFDPLEVRHDNVYTTNALVSWTKIAPSVDGSNPSIGNKVETTDIKSLLTEVVGLTGWASGNAVSILVSPNESYVASNLSIRNLHGVTAAGNKAPELHYTYSENADTSLITTKLTASAHVDLITEQNNTTNTSRNQTNQVSNLFYAGVANQPRKLAFLFDNADIPANAVIKTARLTLHSAGVAEIAPPDSDWTADAGAVLTTEPDDATTPGSTLPDPSPDEPADADTFDININAELTNSPAPYSTGLFGPVAEHGTAARPLTSLFQQWPDVDNTSNTVLLSPDITPVIQEVTSSSGWDVGDGFSIVLTAPPGHNNKAENFRRILTSTDNDKPVLTITWEDPDANSANKVATQTAALRFPNVHVPPNATITSAHLVFRSHKAGDTETIVDISGEDIGNSLGITTTNNDIGQRDRTTAREPWDMAPWPTLGEPFSSPDISRVITEITQRSDWCGGNALTLFLKGDGVSTGLREAVAYESNPIQAPSLHIVYEPDSVTNESYCSNSSVVVSLVDGADDAVENTSTKAVTLTGPSLSTEAVNGDQQSIGFRFRGVNVPPNAIVVSAALELTASNEITDTQNIVISVEDTDHAATYQASNGSISNRNYGQSATWSSGAVVAGESSFTSDLTNLVKQVVDRPGWISGNAMAFRLEGTAARAYNSIDNSEASGARLIVYYQSTRSEAGTRHRDNLKREVDSLVAQGGTPIVDAYYEAAQYFRGGKVGYGLKRGRQSSVDRFNRVSHPSSYTDGTVDRSNSCTDANLNDYSCRFETIKPLGGIDPRYITPISGQCQQNHIVLLSDGKAQSISSQNDVQTLMGAPCTLSGTGSTNDKEMCGREIAKWMFDNDHNATMDEKQNVITHTIGFNIDDPQFLKDMAAAGEGKFYPANSASELLDAFKNIFINVSKTDTSFVAPTTTVSQANRMRNREDVYYSLFKPEGTARWAGNLKKYKIRGEAGQNAVIIDSKDEVAIDPDSGEFKPSSRSFWSSSNDGSSVLLGGAAEKIERNGVSNLGRDVYTYTGVNTNLTDASNHLLPSNPDLDPSWFELPTALAADPHYYTDLVNWLRGQDINDIDGDNDTTESRGEMGDPLHSQPLLLNYADGSSIVYVATNEGFLHAVDHVNGWEKFAFMPKELLKNATRFYENAPTRNKPYGLDGGMSVWIDDTNYNGIIDPGEKAYVYVAMRRGGNSYYALDVSNYNSPKYLWSIQGGTTTLDDDPATADGDFEELSDTWSLPVKSQVRDGDIVRDVLIFGGGYDPNQDPSSTLSTNTNTASVADAQVRTIDGVGRAIFIVDAETGEELWQTDGIDYAEMLYSIPSNIRVIDINLDGLADQLYVGDMGGQIWRVDIDNDTSNSNSLSNRIDGGVIADLAADDAPNARRFYYAPDVSILNTDGYQQLAISIGSGWRAHPLDTNIEDRFYSLRYQHVYSKPINSFGVLDYDSVKIDESNLSDITENTVGTPVENGKRGWYLRLTEDGEKVLGSSLTADGNILFTSYLPGDSSGLCAAAVGAGAVYAVNAYNGDPVLNLDELGGSVLTLSDRMRKLSHAGIPPEADIVFPSAGKATALVGTETVEEFEFGADRRKTFWQEALDDNL